MTENGWVCEGGQGHASVSAKWKHDDDGGHLLVGEPLERTKRTSVAPRSGGLLDRLLPPFLRGAVPNGKVNDMEGVCVAAES